NRLVRGKVRSDLKDAACPFLAEVAMADGHHHRFALNGDLEPTTSALGSYCHALHGSTRVLRSHLVARQATIALFSNAVRSRAFWALHSLPLLLRLFRIPLGR